MPLAALILIMFQLSSQTWKILMSVTGVGSVWRSPVTGSRGNIFHRVVPIRKRTTAAGLCASFQGARIENCHWCPCLFRLAETEELIHRFL